MPALYRAEISIARNGDLAVSPRDWGRSAIHPVKPFAARRDHQIIDRPRPRAKRPEPTVQTDPNQSFANLRTSALRDPNPTLTAGVRGSAACAQLPEALSTLLAEWRRRILSLAPTQLGRSRLSAQTKSLQGATHGSRSSSLFAGLRRCGRFCACQRSVLTRRACHGTSRIGT
jgi:hypothetical protein